MKIGSFLSLSIIDPESGKVIKYQSRIIGKDKHYFFIDYPINIKTRKTYHLHEETAATATYIEENQTPFSFPIEILKKVKLTVPALAVKYPEKDVIKKIQRRKYVRVKAAIDIAVHSPDNNFSPFTSITTDISAGGLSMPLPKDKPLVNVRHLHIWLVFHMASGEYRYIFSESEIIRLKTEDGKRKFISIEFTTLESKEKQTIMQFCFEKQRESRQKGILNN